MKELFFELIQISVYVKDDFIRRPTPEEWRSIYKIALKQSLLGVCFNGVSILSSPDVGDYAGMDEQLYYDWLGHLTRIQNSNNEINLQCYTIQKALTTAKISSSILKGQSVALFYDELAQNRQPGDIDVYVNCGISRAMAFTNSIGQKMIDWDYKHLHLKSFANTEVEMHYRVEVSMNLFRNRKLQKWFERPEIQSMMFCKNAGFVSPSAEFNSFYILLHLYRHFLYEGIGMRQLMDYYFVLKHLEDNSFAVESIKMFKMEKFAGAVMWMINTVFGDGAYAKIAAPDEKEGRFLCEMVMAGGNFGQHDERLLSPRKGKIYTIINILKHNGHLAFHYPTEVLWAPVWVVYHWCWKRIYERCVM